MKVNNSRILYALGSCFTVSLAGVGFVYLGAPGAISFGLIALIASFITLNLAWHHREAVDALNKHAESVAIAGLVLFLPSILIWGLLPALLLLLSIAQLALNLQLVEHKHAHYGLMVSFICLFLGAAEAITGYYLVFIVVYAAAAAICLSYLNADRDGAGHVPFHPVTGTLLLVWLLVLSTTIYLVMPRPPAANLGSQYSVAAKYYKATEWGDEAGTGQSGETGNTDATGKTSGKDRSMAASTQDPSSYQYSGFGDNFDILDNGQASGRGNALLALMSAAHGAYLKVESFDRFDGISWHKSLHYQTQQYLDDLYIELDSVMEPNFQHTVTLINDLGPYIPAAPVAVKLHFPADAIAQDAYQNLKLPGKLQKDIVYTVESFISYHQQRPFSGAAAPPVATDLALYDGFDERIARLAAAVTQTGVDDMSKALLLETYLRQNYQYDADSIVTSQQNTPLDSFLFETRAGHCEFFASALAVMLRSQGIPSRLITGFSATTLNPLTGYYEIYSLDGHAWVEAWIEGKGWMLLEATPPYELPRPDAETMTANQIQSYVRELGKYATLGSDDTPTLAELWSVTVDRLRALLQVLRQVSAEYFPALMITTALLLCCWLLYRHFSNDILAWRLYWRVKRYRHSGSPQDAVFYMQHIHKLLQIKNQPRLPGDSIESLCLHAALQGLDQTSLKSVSEQINTHFYKDTGNGLNGELFKGVFVHIYHHT